MIAVVLSVTPSQLRGVLTRWLLEVAPGVYVGNTSKRIREHLWERIVEDVNRGRALMVWSCRSEQGLEFRAHNHTWETVDLDGLILMQRKRRSDHGKRPAGQRASITRSTDSQDEPRTVATSKARQRRDFRTAVELRHAMVNTTDEMSTVDAGGQLATSGDDVVNVEGGEPR